jgi:hypothetical protein
MKLQAEIIFELITFLVVVVVVASLPPIVEVTVLDLSSAS